MSQTELCEALTGVHEAPADEVFSEAYSLHPIESAYAGVIQKVPAQLGHDWAHGKISVMGSEEEAR